MNVSIIKARLLMSALIVLAYGCSGSTLSGHADATTTDPWSPPPGIDFDSGIVVAGRLWVLPNPIRVRSDWSGDQVSIGIVNIGSEDVRMERIVVTGASLTLLPPDLLEWLSDYEMNGEEACTSHGSLGFSLVLDEVPEVATLIVETEDPTSPTIRVPIVMDFTGESTPSDPYVFSPTLDEVFIWAKPNPLRIERLPTGETSTHVLCILSHNSAALPTTAVITGIRAYGEGLRFTLIDNWDRPPVDLPLEEPLSDWWHLDVSIEYAPETEGDLDGAIAITYLGTWDDEETLVVPIVVR